MTDVSEWQGRVGESWAEEWRRTDRSFGPLTDRLIEAACSEPVRAVLDIGCGAGEVMLRLAERLPSAAITGLDIAPALVAIARERLSGEANVRIVSGDAAVWQPEDGRQFDLLVSRHGVMFFAEPVAAFAHLAGLASPEARLVFSCFRSRVENEWAGLLASVLPNAPPQPDPAAPGPFAFGDPARVETILTEGGWRDIAFAPIDYPMIASGDGLDRAEALEDALGYFRRIGPAARALAEMSGPERDSADGRLRAVLADRYEPGRVALPAAAWIVTARRA